MKFVEKPSVNQRNESIGRLDCFDPIPSPANCGSSEIATSRRLHSLDQGCTKFVGGSQFADVRWGGHAGPGCVRRIDTILRDNAHLNRITMILNIVSHENPSPKNSRQRPFVGWK